jgi:hypothetical protein
MVSTKISTYNDKSHLVSYFSPKNFVWGFKKAGKVGNEPDSWAIMRIVSGHDEQKAMETGKG